jgi:hypothetical protein
MLTTNRVTIKEDRVRYARSTKNWYALRGINAISIVVAVLAVAVPMAWMIGPGVGWLVDLDGLASLSGKDRAVAIDATRGRVLQLCAGLLAAGALLYTARNYALGRQGQVTDRYSRAIAHLGSDKPNERVGGIHALERIMADSTRDHATVVEVLSAFVRERTSFDPHQPWIDPSPDAHQSRHQEGPRLATDVQAALTVLGRRPNRPEKDRIDLRWFDLSGAILADGRFDHRSHQRELCNAKLQYANLASSNVRGASLGGANLSGAHLYVFGWHGGDRKGFDCQGPTEEQVRSAEWDSSTAWPSYLPSMSSNSLKSNPELSGD